MKSVVYMVLSENCNERFMPLKIYIDGNLDHHWFFDKLHGIRMFTEHHDWFRPKESEIEVLHRDTISIDTKEYKFISYDGLTVIFSKEINHYHMHEYTSHILFRDGRSRALVGAGFYRAGNKYGRSESLRMTFDGVKY